MKDIPCVLFAFNRPVKLQQTLSALANQNVSRLIIFVDGPRNLAEEELVHQTKMVAQSVKFTALECIFSDINQGLTGFVDNITRVLQAYPAAVFVEDDCLPMPGFYSFMCQALERYRSDKRVFSIAGYQPLPPKYFQGYPYSLVSAPRFTCWGWATWHHQWQSLLSSIEHYEELFDGLRLVSEMAGSDLPGIARAMAAGQTQESWDIKVAIASLWHKKVHLLATRGLIRNTGLDRSGTHRSLMSAIKGRLFHNRNLVHAMPEELGWPEDTRIDCNYADAFQNFVRQNQRLSTRRLIARGRVLARRYIWPRTERFTDMNLQVGPIARPQKHALLSYIVYPFSIPQDDPRFLRHINIWHAVEMVRVLNRMGYLVDVIDYRDQSFRLERSYELFIGHGGHNFTQISAQLPPRTKRIYFSTGSYWQYHNQAEQNRFADLQSRRGIDLPRDRFIYSSEEAALRSADGILGIGNEHTRQTYMDFPSVRMINGTSLHDDHFEWCDKVYQSGLNNFLYFAGGGAVHKGLDLLLEAFSGLPEHLWICARLEREFASHYARELSAENIHLQGWLQPRSFHFYRMMERCNFCILPTCSEGQSQSVVECMNQGLIPVVSRDAGIDVGDFGILIDDCTVTEIRNLVRKLSSMDLDICRDLSQAARAAATQDYSESVFSESFQNELELLLSGIQGVS